MCDSKLGLVRPCISPSYTYHAPCQLKIIMKINTAYGLALIIGTVAAIVTMAFHPTGFGPHASVEAVAHDMSILVGVHSLALFSVPLLVFGFLGVTMRAGWHRPEAFWHLSSMHYLPSRSCSQGLQMASSTRL